MVYALRVGGVVQGDESDIGYHRDGKGSFSIKISTNGTIEKLLSDDVDGFDFFEFHGFMMWSAWGVLGFIQLACNRYLKTQWRYIMWVHRITGTLILLITWVIGMLALK